MNCTAWNSVRANALANRPSVLPSTAFRIARTTISHGEPRDVEPEHDEGDARRRAPPARRRERERAAVAAEQPELRQRQGHQPLERPRRALAQHGDRRDDEHRDEREEPEQRGSDPIEHAGLVDEEPVEQRDERDRDDEQQRHRARVAAQLQEHARASRGGRRRSCVARLDERRKASSILVAPVRAQDLRRRPSREQPTVTHEHEVVAARRPRPSRGSRREASLRRPQAAERSPRGRAAAAGRVRRSARRARAARAGRRAPSPARRGSAGRPTGAGRRSGLVAETHELDRLVGRVRPLRPGARSSGRSRPP